MPWLVTEVILRRRRRRTYGTIRLSRCAAGKNVYHERPPPLVAVSWETNNAMVDLPISARQRLLSKTKNSHIS